MCLLSLPASSRSRALIFTPSRDSRQICSPQTNPNICINSFFRWWDWDRGSFSDSVDAPGHFFKCCLQILVQYCLPFSLLWIALIRHHPALRSLYNQIKVAIVKITHHVDVCCCSPVASVSAFLAVQCTLWGLAKANHAGNGFYSVFAKKRPVKNINTVVIEHEDTS